MPRCNASGLLLIQNFEGIRLRAYPDPGTGGSPFTIGWGHTASVHPGEVCSQTQALAWLKDDVGRAEDAVARVVEVTLNTNQFSALVSFEYNTGALAGSTLLRLLNAHDFEGARGQFARWVYAGGEVLAGLVARRAAEARLFATPDTGKETERV